MKISCGFNWIAQMQEDLQVGVQCSNKQRLILQLVPSQTVSTNEYTSGWDMPTNKYTISWDTIHRHSTGYTDRPYGGKHSRNTRQNNLTLLLAYYYTWYQSHSILMASTTASSACFVSFHIYRGCHCHLFRKEQKANVAIGFFMAWLHFQKPIDGLNLGGASFFVAPMARE